VYRNAAVLELQREFVVGFLNEVKATSTYNQSADLRALDDLADKFDDDVGIEELEGDTLESVWSMYAAVLRVEWRGQYVLKLRFPNLEMNAFFNVEMIISQFSDGDGIDDNKTVRAVKNNDGTTTSDYMKLRRGPLSNLLDNVPTSFTQNQVRGLHRY